MFTINRSIFLAAALLTIPAVGAMAQQNNPTGNMGSNRSITAAPGTADSQAASGMRTGDMPRTGATANNYGGTNTGTTTPGGTGKTVVPGSNSTQAGVAPSTGRAQTESTGK